MPNDLKLEKGACQVFLCSSPSTFPFSFFCHCWFVVNQDGELSRWEVLWQKRRGGNRWGHLYRDDFPPFSGIEMIPLYRGALWGSDILLKIEGEVAYKLAEFISKTPDTYPRRSEYWMWGPNSNSYIAWVLRHFPELTFRLPWNAFGKGFKKFFKQPSLS